MGVLSHDEFFAKLGELFRSREGKDHGSIYLVQKRFAPAEKSSPSSPQATSTSESEHLLPAPILIHATNGKNKEHRASKIKISTVVQPDDIEAFYARYADVCRTGMTALKPRDRTKRKAKNKKKKVGGGGAGQTSMRAIE